jgi:uncharacterized protein involved in exopolysaccharide biosynthesis
MGNNLIPLPPSAPGQEYLDITRRVPDLEDYVDMARRHRAWVLGPLFAGLVIAVVVAFLWPDTYTSTAVMRITPPQVPERLVPTATNVQMADRLMQMEQDILSQASLSELIQRPALDLYKSERDRKPMVDVVEDMRRNITIRMIDTPAGMGRDRRMASAFRVSFSYPDRYKAQAVVNELVTKFTEQNIRVLRDQTSLTTDFLKDEQDDAKAQLERLTSELAQFRMANQGRLPEQMQSNIAALNSVQMQMHSLGDLINRAQQDKLTLETNLQNLKTQASLLQGSLEETTVAAAATNQRLEQLRKTILDVETAISAMLETYKENHPDVRTRRAQLEVLKRERDRMETQELEREPAARSTRMNPQVERMLQDVKASIALTQTHIQNKELEMAERTRQQSQLQQRVAQLQARIEAAPANEQRYAQLIQDVSIAKQRYEELSKKRELSETAQALEARKGGENLEVLDRASLPEKPTEPNRLMIALAGVGAGLVFGVFVAGAKEMKDTSLKNLKDVRAYTNLPVLSSVPLLENSDLIRKKRRLVWLAWTAAVIVGLLVMAAAIYYYYYSARV